MYEHTADLLNTDSSRMWAFVLGFALSLAVFADAADISQVAFSAALSHNQSLVYDQIVVYDTVFTNIGNGYDQTTGEFTCPRGGLYMFQFHGITQPGAAMSLNLYHNYMYVASAWGGTETSNPNKLNRAPAGNNAIIYLSKGDTVDVRADDETDNQKLAGKPHERYCTFSGYLLAPYNEETVIVG